MLKSNLHTHTKYSDGKNTAEEMISSAISHGFVSIGFSDHSYTDFDKSYCMSREGEPEYRNEIRRLSEKYACSSDITSAGEKFEVFCGIELDADSDIPDYEYDYTIGSVHYLKHNGTYYPLDMSADAQKKLVDEAFRGSWTDMAKAYFDRVAENSIKRKPDIIGHFDLITKYSLVSEDDEAYRDAAVEAVREIVKHTDRFELNTGAIARGLRKTPYPADFMLGEIQRFGGKIIIGSDCHYAERIASWYDESVPYLKGFGFKSVSRLTSCGFIEDML